MSTSTYQNNIGLVLSNALIKDYEQFELFYLDPVIKAKKIIQNKPNDWFRISGTIKADGNYNYVLIGNFNDDEDTKTVTSDSSIRYGYYLIDDVMVRPLRQKTGVEDLKIEVGAQITLNNIYFETGKSNLLETSFEELNKLYEIMHQSPTLVIQINGHTDNQGHEADNQILSDNRAKAVADYLKNKGINIDNIKTKGFGESQPISTNETKEGRQLNRRVDCMILRR